MRSRALREPESQNSTPAALLPESTPPPQSLSDNAPGASENTLGRTAIEPDPDRSVDQNGDAEVHDYTWKTLVCECETSEQAWQLKEVLRRAGIESWFEFDGQSLSFVPQIQDRVGVGGLRVLVAADQLDQARAVAARPIPPEIVEESKTSEPDYSPPTCPRCGASDPILEAVDPVNYWKCDQCGASWTDSAAPAQGSGSESGREMP
jgi:ribosomal protein L37AE/L43A